MKKQNSNPPVVVGRHVPKWTLTLAAAGMLTHVAVAQIQSAGALLVSVDATKLEIGPLPNIANTGSLGGFFVATGPETDRPAVGTVGGTKAIVFDGTDFLRLASSTSGETLVNAPEGLVGESPTRSIEVWTLNPSVAGEETLVSWAKRGGPDGSNVSFGYGSDFRWGAMGHWGGDGPDLGWNNDGGNPPANKWHHLVYTFDGKTSRVYSDGVLANGELVRDGIIVTHPDTTINIATQLEADGITPTGGLRYSGAIARVRIHDGVLTDGQILANYTAEKADFIDPGAPPAIVPGRITQGPVHRYSFADPAAADATDKQFKDSVGTAHGTILGEGTSLSGSRLVLAGGPSATAGYGDLPNGLISKFSTNNGGPGEFTIETWMKVTGARTWSRVFDIGSSLQEPDNEVSGPGGGGEGKDYLTVTAQIDGDTGNRRLELRNEDPSGGGVLTSDSSTRSFGKDFHIAVTWKESTGRVTLYEDGKEASSVTTDDAISDLRDVNVWLGRSNWNGDQNTQGEYDEVRIYNYALTPQQAAGNAIAGADLLNIGDAPVTIKVQPVDASTSETLPATFSVTVTGSTPVAFQWRKNGVDIPGATDSTYSIPSVVSADNGAKFSVKVSNGTGATAITVASSEATLSVVSDVVSLKHRYSFSETSGTSIKDSAGTANGTLVGTGALGAGRLALDGSDGFVDLPNGIISALGDNGTIEAWFTYDGGGNWARVWDFGTQDDGENGAGNGLDYLAFTAKTAQGFGRLYANFPSGGDATVISTPGSTPVGQEFHIALAYSFTTKTARIYTNGVLVSSGAVSKRLSELTTDVNNWLGKSQFPADPLIAGKYNEFRIHKGAMSAAQVMASFTAGPDALPGSGGGPIPNLSARREGNSLIVSWPTGESGLKLEGTDSLAPANWQVITGGLTTAGGRDQVTLPVTGSTRFLRLKR